MSSLQSPSPCAESLRERVVLLDNRHGSFRLTTDLTDSVNLEEHGTAVCV